MIEKFDTNGDGKLNKKERKAARKAMKARKAAFIKKYDADGDGKLDEKERKAARKAGASFPRHYHGHKKGRKHDPRSGE